jgi:drug/metabolite transporter (DMT)-like permease
MASWYHFSLIALILFGIQRFLYKVSADWKCDTAVTTISFMVTVSLLAILFFFIRHERFEPLLYLLVVSCINGCAFAIGTISTIEALKYISGSIVFPLTRLSTVLVVIFSILFFGDEPSFLQCTGLIIAIFVIIFFARYDDKSVSVSIIPERGIILGLIALISGAVAAISSKFAATHVSTYAFIALSYVTGALLTYPIRDILQKERIPADLSKSFFIGAIIGVINFAGFLYLLKALAEGPLSLIISITGMHFVITIILSATIFSERISVRKMAAIAMTIVSVFLMRF